MNGIIIKTQDYGETHKLVTIFSKKLGKFTALARGAKKPKSRMAAVTQPFVYGEFFVYVNTGLSTIQQGEILDSYRQVREDIIKTAYAAYIGELSDKLLESKKPVPHLFDQFLQTLDWMKTHDEVTIPIMMYEMKIFEEGGFGPVVHHCVNCGKKEAPFLFSIKEGGLLCRNCHSLDINGIPMSNTLVKLIYTFAKVGLEQVGTISVKEENEKILRKILDAYYDQYGGHYLKTKKFLSQIDLLK